MDFIHIIMFSFFLLTIFNMPCIIKVFLMLMVMIFLFWDLCTAAVLIFWCRNQSVFRRRFCSCFISLYIFIMILNIPLTLLSLPFWLYTLRVIPQENKRSLFCSGEFVIHLHGSTLELECSVNKAHLAVQEFSMGFLFIRGSTRRGMDVHGDAAVQNLCTQRHIHRHLLLLSPPDGDF